MYPLLWFGFTDLFLHIFIHKMCALKNDTMGENIFFFLRGRKTYSYMYPFTLVWVHWFIFYFYVLKCHCNEKKHYSQFLILSYLFLFLPLSPTFPSPIRSFYLFLVTYFYIICILYFFAIALTLGDQGCVRKKLMVLLSID
jgi:hypothetical protein